MAEAVGSIPIGSTRVDAGRGRRREEVSQAGHGWKSYLSGLPSLALAETETSGLEGDPQDLVEE
jgi:hypothetical protein